MIFKINNFYNFLIVFFFLVLSQNQSLSIENKIVLKIDNEIITNIDIKNEINYLKALNLNFSELDKNQILEIAKKSLIREKIKEKTILTRVNQIKVNDEYLDGLIANIYSKINLQSKQEFINHIKKYNLNLPTIEYKISIEALWNELIITKFSSKIKIDNEKLRNNILNNRKSTNSYLLYEIVFNVEQNETIKKKFNTIEKSINKNGFENAALIYSISETSKIGGKLGWINESSINQKIFNEILKLKINGYTQPIVIPGGFLVLNLKNKKNIEKKIDIDEELKKAIIVSKNYQLNQYSNFYFKKISKDAVIDEK